ncbi:MAG: tetratricopeptide repeat protein [Flavobacteriia bacterium]|nr:tetratricopeptide repeat protein [Flavobacteriia bacterium]
MILFCFIGVIFPTFCQNTTTVDCSTLESSPANLKSIEKKINEGFDYFSKGEKKKSIDNYSIAICLAQKIKNSLYEAKAVDGLGLVYAQTSDFYKAYICFNNSLDLYKSENNIKGIGVASSHLGNTLRYLGNHPKALNYMYDALKICKQLNDQDGIGKNYINIALTFQEFKNYDAAIKYNNYALNIYKEKKDTSLIGTIYNNLGTIYQDQTQYKKALYYYKKALYLGEKCNSCFHIGSTIGNIGLIHVENQNYKLALEFQNKSLDYALKNDYKEGQADAYFSLGSIYQKQDKIKEALLNFEKAFNLAEKYGFEKLLINSSKKLATIYNENNDEHNALKFLKINSEHNEKLIITEKIQLINDTKAKYEIEQYESEILDLQNKKEIDFLQKAILISTIFLILIIRDK